MKRIRRSGEKKEYPFIHAVPGAIRMDQRKRPSFSVIDSYFEISTNTLLYDTPEKNQTRSKERIFMRERVISDKVIRRMEAGELPVTRGELDRAAENISALAKLHGVPEAEIRSGISQAIQAFCGSQNPRAQALQRTVPFSGSNPSPEEFLLWFRNLFIAAMEEQMRGEEKHCIRECCYTEKR